jgi:hypothetical protein
MTVSVADAIAHVQRLVSVVKKPTLLEECTTDVQFSLVCFCGEANWQEKYCFIMTMPDPIQPEQLSREF